MTDSLLARLVRDDSGQDLIEYGLLAALVSLAAFGAMQTLGTSIDTLFGTIKTKVDTLGE